MNFLRNSRPVVHRAAAVLSHLHCALNDGDGEISRTVVGKSRTNSAMRSTVKTSHHVCPSTKYVATEKMPITL